MRDSGPNAPQVWDLYASGRTARPWSGEGHADTAAPGARIQGLRGPGVPGHGGRSQREVGDPVKVTPVRSLCRTPRRESWEYPPDEKTLGVHTSWGATPNTPQVCTHRQK